MSKCPNTTSDMIRSDLDEPWSELSRVEIQTLRRDLLRCPFRWQTMKHHAGGRGGTPRGTPRNHFLTIRALLNSRVRNRIGSDPATRWLSIGLFFISWHTHPDSGVLFFSNCHKLAVMETLLPFSRHLYITIGVAFNKGLIVLLPGAGASYECCCQNYGTAGRCGHRSDRREDILMHVANKHTIAFDYLKRGAWDSLVSCDVCGGLLCVQCMRCLRCLRLCAVFHSKPDGVECACRGERGLATWITRNL